MSDADSGNLTEEAVRYYSALDKDVWENIDVIDSRSSIYYYYSITEERSQELADLISSCQIIAISQFGTAKWDSKMFQEYRMLRWAARREKNKETNPSLSDACDTVAHYLYKLSIGDLPKDRLSLEERFDTNIGVKKRV